MASAVDNLRGLILNASDIQALTGWPAPMVEDYLSLIDSIIAIANIVDTKADAPQPVTIVTTTPFEVPDVDGDIWVDTSAGDMIVNLKAGSQGRAYRIVNIGASGNKVTLNPFGTEDLFNQNSSEDIYDDEALDIVFDDNKGWN